MQTHITAARLTADSYYYAAKIENRHSDVQANYENIGNRRYIVFPGTSGEKDWRTNFKFNSSVSPYGGEGYHGKVRLHRGFYEAYLSVREDVLEAATRDSDLDLILAGHSAGGAIAQIAAVDINYHLDRPVETITYGSPACGNKYWQSSARKRITTNTNYINIFDPVPFSLLCYRHLSPLIWLTRVHLDPHGIANYIDSLQHS